MQQLFELQKTLSCRHRFAALTKPWSRSHCSMKYGAQQASRGAFSLETGNCGSGIMRDGARTELPGHVQLCGDQASFWGHIPDGGKRDTARGNISHSRSCQRRRTLHGRCPQCAQGHVLWSLPSLHTILHNPRERSINTGGLYCHTSA